MASNAFSKAAKRLAKRRATLMVLASIVIGVFLASGVALAATINCPNRAGNLCVGTDNRDIMYGTSAQDVMRGTGGADTLRARAGADRLTGGANDDKLGGGDGSDVYVFGDDWSVDRITRREGSGADTLDFTGVGRGVSVTLVPSDRRPEGLGPHSDRLQISAEVVLENVRGTPQGDTIQGNDTRNHFWGYRGREWLIGHAGNDVLDGGVGDDDLSGDQGNDTLTGGPGVDDLGGWEGDDTIYAIDGTKDYITCSDGNDTVHYDQGLDLFQFVENQEWLTTLAPDASCETTLMK